MNNAVLIGTGGLAGWNLLKRTAEQQRQLVAADPLIARSVSYFRNNIANASRAEDLVSDYQLLNVALGAHGLGSDIGSKAFIRRVLESPRADDRSLVNRLSDKRYLRLASTFDYDQGADRVASTGFADRIANLYIEREFERRIGEGDPNLRLALNAKRELRQMAGRISSESTLWYEVMGNPPLRKVFEQAFGFSSAYGKLPIDRQMAEFTTKAKVVFGSSSFDVIAKEPSIDKLAQTFLLRAQLDGDGTASSYSIALTLLGG